MNGDHRRRTRTKRTPMDRKQQWDTLRPRDHRRGVRRRTTRMIFSISSVVLFASAMVDWAQKQLLNTTSDNNVSGRWDRRVRHCRLVVGLEAACRCVSGSESDENIERSESGREVPDEDDENNVFDNKASECSGECRGSNLREP